MRTFPEREVLLRADGRVRFFRLNCAAQVTGVVLLLLLLPAVLYTTGRDLLFPESVIAQKSMEVDQLKSAYEKLKSSNAESQSRYRVITQQLEAKHAYLMNLLQQNESLRADVGQMQGALQASDADRREIAESRRALALKMRQLESSVHGLASEKEVLVGSLNEKESELRELVMDRARVMLERWSLEARSEELQQRLASLQTGQQEVLDRLSARTAGSIGEIKSLIARTGLDPNRLLSGAATSGVGGPYLKFDAARDGKRGDSQIAELNSHIDQWDELQRLLRRLPLAAPLDSYVQMSSYGKRRDPINGNWAMHHGIDLVAATNSPVRSAAPGVVVFAGTNGNYGRMVEVDHGLGIRTRYGHLSTVSVRKGQTVGYRQPIGVIGSTGRSTGLHLHYEVLVKDTPHDPMRFIEAGKDVFKG